MGQSIFTLLYGLGTCYILSFIIFNSSVALSLHLTESNIARLCLIDSSWKRSWILLPISEKTKTGLNRPVNLRSYVYFLLKWDWFQNNWKSKLFSKVYHSYTVDATSKCKTRQNAIYTRQDWQGDIQLKRYVSFIV